MKKIIGAFLVTVLLLALLPAAYAAGTAISELAVSGGELSAGDTVENDTRDIWTLEGGCTVRRTAAPGESLAVTADCTVSPSAGANTLTLTPHTYTVSFQPAGGSPVAAVTDVPYGSGIAAPAAPIWEGHAFAGWYREEALRNEWHFGQDTVTADLTLYAKWVELPDYPWSLIDGDAGLLIPHEVEGNALKKSDVVYFIPAKLPSPAKNDLVIFAMDSNWVCRGLQYDGTGWAECTAYMTDVFRMAEEGQSCYVVGAVSREPILLLTATQGGSVSADPAEGWQSGQKVNLTATADTGYSFRQWVCDKTLVNLGSLLYNSSAYFTMGEESLEMQAIFQPKLTMSQNYMMVKSAPTTITITVGQGIEGFDRANNYAGWVKVNGVVINDSRYIEVTSGSIVVTLKKAYLNTLPLGEYRIEIGLENSSVDSVTAVLTVGSVPRTADGSRVALWCTVLALGVTAVVLTEVKKRRAARG